MIEKTYIIKEMFRDAKVLWNNYSRQTLCFLKREKRVDIKEVVDMVIDQRPTFKVISNETYDDVATLILKEKKGTTIEIVVIYACIYTEDNKISTNSIFKCKK